MSTTPVTPELAAEVRGALAALKEAQRLAAADRERARHARQDLRQAKGVLRNAIATANRAIAERSRSATLVYFIQAGEGGPIKIGVSNNVDERLRLLQTGNPHKLRVLATSSSLSERHVHLRFRTYLIRGEWFRPEVDLLDFIESIARPACAI